MRRRSRQLRRVGTVTGRFAASGLRHQTFVCLYFHPSMALTDHPFKRPSSDTACNAVRLCLQELTQRCVCSRVYNYRTQDLSRLQQFTSMYIDYVTSILNVCSIHMCCDMMVVTAVTAIRCNSRYICNNCVCNSAFPLHRCIYLIRLRSHESTFKVALAKPPLGLIGNCSMITGQSH